jgi:hypothetical protein
MSIKRYANNNNNNNNNNDTVSANVIVTSPTPEPPQAGLYREPRLNKSESSSLTKTQQQYGGGLLNRCQGTYVPLSPNSIDNRLVYIFVCLFATVSVIYY